MSSNRTPQMGEVMERLLGAQLSELRAIDVGEVESWDKTSQTATIRPTILNSDGSARPSINRCAVVFPGVYWDIQVGEHGLLLVCDRDYRRWWRVSEDSVPAIGGGHDIGNSVFLAGLKTSASARDVPTNGAVLEKPVAGGTVRLGVWNAFKAVVHEDLQSSLNTFLTALSTWVTQVDALGPFAGTPGLQNAITALKNDDYTSATVFVED